MSRRSGRVLVVGGGVFGVTAAAELARRGCDVELADPGPLPHPAASSTDLSKAVRMDYGSDEFYSELAAECLDRWRAWNERWPRPLFHETGILLLSRRAMAPGSFEGDSFETLRRRGVSVERLDAARLGERFPAWRGSGYDDGYFNPAAGWAESGAVMAWLVSEARAAGVSVLEGRRCTGLLEEAGRVCGARLDPGGDRRAEQVLVAAGAWTPSVLPHLRPLMQAVGQPVVHLVPREAGPFDGRRFPVWCAEIATTGWYGFPRSAEGTVKIGNHGPGRRLAPGDDLVPLPAEVARATAFAAATFPDLAPARVAASRLCLYCDTVDGDFLIDHDPGRPGLVVAAGGSGHAFKFAPLLGSIVADVVQAVPDRRSARFAWREGGAAGRAEQARRRAAPRDP